MNKKGWNEKQGKKRKPFFVSYLLNMFSFKLFLLFEESWTNFMSNMNMFKSKFISFKWCILFEWAWWHDYNNTCQLFVKLEEIRINYGRCTAKNSNNDWYESSFMTTLFDYDSVVCCWHFKVCYQIRMSKNSIREISILNILVSYWFLPELFYSWAKGDKNSERLRKASM